jgi:hypothetical protein
MSRATDQLPGADLVEAGIAELERGVESVEALLVSIGAPRLSRLGQIESELYRFPAVDPSAFRLAVESTLS